VVSKTDPYSSILGILDRHPLFRAVIIEQKEANMLNGLCFIRPQETKKKLKWVGNDSRTEKLLPNTEYFGIYFSYVIELMA
jgi:hypothetical protein